MEQLVLAEDVGREERGIVARDRRRARRPRGTARSGAPRWTARRSASRCWSDRPRGESPSRASRASSARILDAARAVADAGRAVEVEGARDALGPAASPACATHARPRRAGAAEDGRERRIGRDRALVARDVEADRAAVPRRARDARRSPPRPTPAATGGSRRSSARRCRGPAPPRARPASSPAHIPSTVAPRDEMARRAPARLGVAHALAAPRPRGSRTSTRSNSAGRRHEPEEPDEELDERREVLEAVALGRAALGGREDRRVLRPREIHDRRGPQRARARGGAARSSAARASARAATTRRSGDGSRGHAAPPPANEPAQRRARCGSCDARAATSAGVPSTTTRPPASPPSGPRSITWSEAAITARLCSITSDRVAAVDEAAQDGDQAIDVLAVETRRRLVEDVERLPLAAALAELGHELQALRLAARERGRGLAEREVAEPHLGHQLEDRARRRGTPRRPRAPRRTSAPAPRRASGPATGSRWSRP